MFGLTGCLHTANRTRTIGLGLAITALAMMMSIWAPAAAHASGCEDSWAAKGSGSWFEGANWSKKAPPTASEEACITENGTYTVTMTQTTSTVTVKSLTVGGSSGTQTLVVSGSNALNATLTAASGIGVTSTGAVRLTNVENEGNNVTVVAPVTNAGTITTEAGVGTGTRVFQGNLKNTGTLAVNTTTTFNGASAAFTNEGALDVAEGKSLTVSNKDSFTNGTGGKIVATGSGNVFLESGTSFTEAAGTTTGTMPVIVDDGALAYAGPEASAGASMIILRGTSKLSGSISKGQALVIQGTNAENATTTAAADFTNAGTITLTQIENEGNAAVLVVSSGSLENTGTITSEAGSGSGVRDLEGALINKGTVAVDTTTDFDGTGGVLTNDGAVDIATGATFSLPSGQTFSNDTGGTIATTGTGVFDQRSGTFNQGGGTDTGTALVLDDDTLNYTGAGASTIDLRGTSKLSGSSSKGQALIIQGTNSENATTTAASGFSNAGTITLTQIENEGNNATLVLSAGTLTNSGTITTEVGGGAGLRTIEGNLTNTGTLTIDAATAFSGGSTTLTNDGAINIATGTKLSLPSGQTFSNETGGTIAATGTGLFEQRSGTFNQGGGTDTGTALVLDDDTLNYTGTGASTIDLRGTSKLSGKTISKGQSLTIQGTNSENATTTAAAGFTNAGTITLTQIENEGNSATLVLHTGTLDNKGTLNGEAGGGAGARTIEGSLKNEKTLSLGAGVDLKVTGTYTQTKAGTLKTAIGSSSSYGVLSVTSTATIAGNLGVTVANKFKGLLGQNYNILTSSALTGTFAKETGGGSGNSNGLYYKPTYSATGVTLVVSQATLVLSVTKGLPGTVVTLSGKGYLPEDTITPSFTDHAKVKTIFTAAAVKTNSSGEFSTEITIPAGAAVGAGKITVASANTGLSFSKTFTVT